MYPEDDNQFLVGQKNKKALQWDVRTKEIVQEYDRHMDQINTITFIDNVRLSTQAYANGAESALRDNIG